MQILNTHFKRCSSYFKPLQQMQKIDPITTLRSRIHTPSNDSTIRKLNAVHEQERKAIVSEVAQFYLNAVQKGRKINHLLTDAVQHCSVQELEYTLKMGVDPNLVGQYGETPLLAACGNPYLTSRERTEMIELLLKSGADPLIVCNVGSQNAITPLEHLRIKSQKSREHEHDLDAILDLFYKHTACAEEAEALLLDFNQSRNNE